MGLQENFNYDLLLEYLSYKDCGKYIDFKKYIKDIIYEEQDAEDIRKLISQIRRTLSALGHVEFFFDGNNSIYKVAQRVISILPNSTKGVLCGYRTNDFLDKVKNKCQQLGFGYTEEDNYSAPKAIFIDFKEKENIEICQMDNSILGSDIKIVTDFSKKLLSVYPKLDDIINNAPSFEDIGQTQVYSTTKHNFCDKSKEDYSVCKQSHYGYDKYFIYRSNNSKYYEVDVYTAILKQYKESKGNVFVVDGNNLHIKYIDGLPELIDRALTLASGKNRQKGYMVGYKSYKKEDKTYTKSIYSKVYDNINEELVDLLKVKTGLEVEVNNG